MGPILPPSIALVVYGWLAHVSIGGLFMAGLLLGIFMALLLMSINVLFCANGLGVMSKSIPFYVCDVVRTGKLAILPLLISALIRRGIRGGSF